MSLPSGVRSHQTIWVDLPNGHTAAVRFAIDEDRVVCFGDDGLRDLVAGTRVTASVRGLADGPLETSFWVSVNELDGADVSIALLSDLVGDRPLGRTADEVVRNLEAMRGSRRLLALDA